MRASSLTRLDFELAYLVLLTRYGLKPLSRWEGALDRRQQRIIRHCGLTLSEVERRTRLGSKRMEIVFAASPRHVAFYRDRFGGTRLRLTPDVIRTEGHLFGYPSCCVEAFTRAPYTANHLSRADQGLLFHWACRDCRTTPGLLREYRWVHAECRRLFGSANHSEARTSPAWLPLAKAAASLALIAGATGAAGLANTAGASGPGSMGGAARAGSADDPHLLPVVDDADQDYLSVAEEIITGSDWSLPDCDNNQVLDGVQLAQGLLALIQAPPEGVVVTDHMMWGIETCSVCGATVNMGYVEITHTRRGLTVELPYIALHYLEHGSFSFEGDLHTGRADIEALKAILAACDEPHLLPVPGLDPDQDGLHSEEEPVLGTDPEDPDSDGDSLIDGPQVAETLLPIVGDLPREPMDDRPYLQEFWTYGIEQCTVCGQQMNMGGIEIHNPLEELIVTVPFAALHGAAHGSFVYDGTVNQGHIVPSVLQTAVTGDGSAHWIPVEGDGDGDGLTDEEEPFFGYDPEQPDENDNGIPDGRELAMEMRARIDALPQGPLPDQTHRIEHPTFGHYNCVTCGEEINMGFCEIIDPLTGHSAEVPYYNLHFMERGSFATDRDDLYPRVDPCAIGLVLDMQASGVGPVIGQPGFAFSAGPNPAAPGDPISIFLALSGVEGQIEVAVFDPSGRRVRNVYAGPAPEQALRIVWDGRDEMGRAVAAGAYYCRARFGGMSVARKVVVAQ